MSQRNLSDATLLSLDELTLDAVHGGRAMVDVGGPVGDPDPVSGDPDPYRPICPICPTDPLTVFYCQP
ncbi:MAG: hypothetical protein U0235_01860 [Polyangiaceae bacterium]